MPAEIAEVIERDGDIINVYVSGAEYNVTKKKLVKPASHTLITAENATALNRRRQEMAREELIAGANEAVAELRPDLLDAVLQGNQAYVRAIGYATTKKALNPKDPKQTEAARLMLNVGERLGQDEQGAPADLRQTPRLVLVLQQLHERQSVVDGTLLSESDISESNNVRIDEQDDGTEPGSPTGGDDGH
jgi:hypothetical protein